MSNAEEKKRKEVKIFKQFAVVCPLNICSDSIHTQDPPKPDIICQIADGKKIEFELAEAMDQKYRDREALSHYRTYRGVRDYYNSMPKIKKEELVRRYGNANISFEFDKRVKGLRKVYPVIFNFLFQLDNNFTGDTEPKTPELCNICKKIGIYRDDKTPGPLFNEFPGGYVCEGVYERILDKFNNKSYKPTYSLHLLVHADSSVKDIWIEDVHKFVEENIANSQFERVWLFDDYNGKIEYVYPEFNFES